MNTEIENLIKEFRASVEDVKKKDASVIKALQSAVDKNGNTVASAVKKAEEAAAQAAAAINKLEDIEQKMASSVKAGNMSKKTFADALLESDQFKAYKAGNTQKMTFRANTIIGQEGSPPANSSTIVAPDRRPGIVSGPWRNLTIRDLLPQVATTSNLVEFTRESLLTNNADGVNEGAQKPESVLNFALVQGAVATIATFLKASKQVLDDSAQLADYINRRLAYAVNLTLENQLISGTGLGNTIKGLLAAGNHTVFTPTSGENALDSINRMIEQVAVLEGSASGIVMNTKDWHRIERLKVGSNDARYVVGDPHAAIMRVLWGLPVAVSNSVPEGTAIVADFNDAATFYLRQETVVEFFEQDEDNVQKNLITIRGEMRGVLAVEKPFKIVAGTLTAS